LEEVNLGQGEEKQPTYVRASLGDEQKSQLIELLWSFIYCFAWTYTVMPGPSMELVEHVLPIMKWFKPYKQPLRNFSPELLGRIKEEAEHLLEAKFIRTCHYAEWISNIVPVEKKNTGKIRICVDFHNLNQATPRDGYPMPIAEDLINRALGHKVISFLDGNAG
jgi:hypothetical protein